MRDSAGEAQQGNASPKRRTVAMWFGSRGPVSPEPTGYAVWRSREVLLAEVLGGYCHHVTGE
jgi:hypothetical protein